MIPAIEAISLTKTLGRRTVLGSLDLRSQVGETTALRGANGAGKTTLLRCLAGLLRPASGLVLWLGERADVCRAAPRPVGLLGHESFLYPELTAEENLLFAARMHRIDQPRRRARHWLERSLPGDAWNCPAGRLSRGMRQRLSLARAVIHDPPVALFDEPLTGLDDDGRRWLEELFHELRSGRRTVLFSTHDESLAERVADRVLWLAGGRLQGTPPGEGRHDATSDERARFSLPAA